MKFKWLIAAALFGASAMAMAAESKTPEMDKATMAIKQMLWSKGMNRAPTHIYLAALTELKVQMCGATYLADDIPLQLEMASTEGPALLMKGYQTIFFNAMRKSLLENPAEAKALCE